MVRRAVAFVFGLGVFGSLSGTGQEPGLPVASARAEERADGCVAFRKSELEKGIAFDVESSCGVKLACTVSWVLECADNDGHVESRSARSERFVLAGGESRTVRMSAESCKQSWKVDDVRWGCDPVKR